MLRASGRVGAAARATRRVTIVRPISPSTLLEKVLSECSTSCNRIGAAHSLGARRRAARPGRRRRRAASRSFRAIFATTVRASAGVGVGEGARSTTKNRFQSIERASESAHAPTTHERYRRAAVDILDWLRERNVARQRRPQRRQQQQCESDERHRSVGPIRFVSRLKHQTEIEIETASRAFTWRRQRAP